MAPEASESYPSASSVPGTNIGHLNTAATSDAVRTCSHGVCRPTVYQPLVYKDDDGILSTVFVNNRMLRSKSRIGVDNQAILCGTVAELNLLPPLRSSLKMRTLSASVSAGVS